jgi:hypothetical protein
MIKKTAGKRKSAKSGNMHKAMSKNGNDPFAIVDAYLPTGSPQRAVAGIAAAAGGALLAAAMFGAGTAALAGAAGYVVYRETCKE